MKTHGHWLLPESTRALEGGGEEGGYDPQDLQSAYDIPVSGGEQRRHYEEQHTIALIEVGDDETAESDLAAYRHQYGLEPCTKGSSCFRQVNEHGEEGNLPTVFLGWELETSLDLDMASATCPHCHILLVEASLETIPALAESANTAARLGATEISNSYGVPEQFCGENHCGQVAEAYDHPGVVVTASAGDAGYDNYLRGDSSPLFPASLPYVIAVGGTSLRRLEDGEGRKWSESVWWEPNTRALGTGSGCSPTEPKPIWQKDSGCAGRTDNDVAAVGACETPVSIYSSYYEGWVNVCGTSVSAPLLAGIEAHADESAGTAVPTADAFYQDKSSLYDVTTGRDAAKCSLEYLCNAEQQIEGYDGPIGNGTPAQGPVAVAGEPPSVRTEPPAAGASLNGVLDPNGLETSYYFEYGTSTSYGARAPAEEASAGSGTAATMVSASLTGVVPGLYHYRLVATNGDGKVYGPDQTTDSTPPTVTKVAPATGWTFGGAHVTITGSNFVGVTGVTFGSGHAGSYTVLSSTEIEAVSPAGSGTVDVSVEDAGGASSSTEADRFSYLVLPPPTVSGIAPASGWPQGETVVTITGSNFADVRAVDFGSTPATSFEVVSETEIEAISPAGAGAVDATVTTPSGTSPDGEADRFTYEEHPLLPEPAWLSPSALAGDMPWADSPDPQVAVDPRGDAATVWTSCRGSGESCEGEVFVEAAYEPDGGRWTAPARLSPSGDVYQTPSIAFDERGDAVTVFDLSGLPEEGEAVDAVVRPVGQGWQQATTLSHGCEGWRYPMQPHLAVNAAGDAVATWRCEYRTGGEHHHTFQILDQAAYKPAGGSWQEPVTLAERAEDGPEETLSSPTVAIDSHGDVVAGWGSQHLVSLGKEGTTFYSATKLAYRPAGGMWQKSTEITEDGGTPQLAFDGHDNAYALIEQAHGYAVTERPSLGSWQAPTQIASPEGYNQPFRPDFAVDSQGDAIAIWTRYKGEWVYIQAAHKPADGSWQKPITLSRACYEWELCISEPVKVAYDGSGDAVAVWEQETRTGFVLRSERLPEGGSWRPPRDIPRPEHEVVDDPDLALDASGNGLVAWESLVPGPWEFNRRREGPWTVYTAPYAATVVKNVEPDSGPQAGETDVTITGEGFGGATSVKFGSTDAMSFQVESETQIKAVAPPGSGTVDVTVTTPEGASPTEDADRFAYQGPPTGLTGHASEVTRASATLNGTVDPQGLSVSDCHFEYGTSPMYGQSAPCAEPLGSGGEAVPASAPVTGLSRNTSYYFRIVATNSDGTAYGAQQTFKTLPYPPTVTTGGASPVYQVTATLNATVDAGEEAISGCRFEYGVAPTVGYSEPCSSLPSTTETPEPVSAVVTGLAPNSTYYYRIAATNAGGTSYGSQQTFTTAAPELPEVGRCERLERSRGKFTDAKCTKVSAGGETGHYEWEPWPLSNPAITAEATGATLETAGKTTVRCNGPSHGTGEYTGSQTASLSLLFTGCEASGAISGQCQNIQTATLAAKLGFIVSGTKPTGGWDMAAVAPPDLTTFDCGGRIVAIGGSTVAPITKLDKMSDTFTITYKAKKGGQAVEGFESGVKDVLSLIDESGEEPAGLTTTLTISTTEPLEIKAIA